MAVQDQINEKSYNLAIKTTTKAAKLTGKALMWLINKGIKKLSAATDMTSVNRTGKVTLKSLLKTNGGETVAEIDPASKRDFDKIARQYGVKYSIRRAPKDENGKYTYTVFVKAKDKAVLESMMKDYAEKVYNKEKKAANKGKSLSERLDKAKQSHKDMAQNIKEQNIDNIKDKVKEIRR